MMQILPWLFNCKKKKSNDSELKIHAAVGPGKQVNQVVRVHEARKATFLYSSDQCNHALTRLKTVP
jgi:hypothetical protein